MNVTPADVLGSISPALITVEVLWILFLIGTAVVTRRLVGYRRFNTFSLFLPVVMITNGLAVPLSFGLNSLVTGYDLSARAFRDYWLSMGLMFAAIPLGVALANRFRRPHRQPHRILRTPGAPVGALLYVVAIVLVSVVSLLQIYHDGLQIDPRLYFGGFGSYADYEAHRYSFAQATSGAAYFIYNKLPYGLAPIAYVLIWTWKGWGLALRLALIGIIAFALMQTGHKLPLVFIGGTVVVAQLAIGNQMRLSRRAQLTLAGTAAIVILVILPAFYFAQGNTQYASALFWAVERVMVESYRTLQLHFEVYPQYHGFLHGLSQRSLAFLFGVRDYMPVSEYIPSTFLGIGNTSFPALFIGEAWADFGFAGVVAAAIAVGFLLQAYNVWYFNRSVHYLEDSALLVAVAMCTLHLLHSGIITVLSTYGLGTSFVLYLLMKRVHSRHAGGAGQMAADAAL